MSKETLIRISRGGSIVKSRNIAIIRLNSIEHIVGQPVMIRYYKDEDNEIVDSIVAVGVKDGVGRDCYKIISINTNLIIEGFLDELPDISTIINGERVYIVKIDGIWNVVYENGSERTLSPITKEPFVVYDTSCNLNWYYVNGEFKREDDFVTEEENKKNLEKSLNQVKNPALSIEYNGNACEELGTELESPEFTVYVSDYAGVDITDEVLIKVFSDKSIPELSLKPVNHKITVPGYFSETDTIHFIAEYAKDDFVVHSETVNHTIYFQNPVYYVIVSSTEEILEPNANKKILWTGEGKLEIPAGNLNNQYDIIWIPRDIEIDSIHDLSESTYTNEFEIQEKELNGKSYNVYVRKDPETIEDLTLVLVSKIGAEVLISSSDKNAVLTEIRTTIKSEIKAEVWDEVKSNLKSEVKAETKAEVTEELHPIVRQEIKDDLKPELKEEIVEEVKPVIKEQLEAELTPAIIESIKTELTESLTPIMITKEDYEALVISGEVLADRTYYIYDPEEDED